MKEIVFWCAAEDVCICSILDETSRQLDIVDAKGRHSTHILAIHNPKVCPRLVSHTFCFAAADVSLHSSFLCRGPGALLTPEHGYVPATSPGKKAHENRLDRSQNISAQTLDAPECIWGPLSSNTNPFKVTSPGQLSWSPRSTLLVQPWTMRCDGLPHICSDSAHGRKKALQTSMDAHIYMCT